MARFITIMKQNTITKPNLLHRRTTEVERFRTAQGIPQTDNWPCVRTMFLITKQSSTHCLTAALPWQVIPYFSFSSPYPLIGSTSTPSALTTLPPAATIRLQKSRLAARAKGGVGKTALS